MIEQEYPWLKFEIEVNGETKYYTVDPSEVYNLAASGIHKQLAGEITEDMPEVEKNVVRLTRATVKGAFIAFGGKILEIMFKSKNHPKPQKGDDIIEWYSNMFAQIAIAQATQGTLILRGKEYGKAIVISEIYPVSLAGSPGGTDTGESTGNTTDEQAPELERV